MQVPSLKIIVIIIREENSLIVKQQCLQGQNNRSCCTAGHYPDFCHRRGKIGGSRCMLPPPKKKNAIILLLGNAIFSLCNDAYFQILGQVIYWCQVNEQPNMLKVFPLFCIMHSYCARYIVSFACANSTSIKGVLDSP